MGYGYLGSYIAYGFSLMDTEEKALEKFLEENEWDMCYETDLPHVFIKRFGTDETPMYFVCWGKCWRGGEFWDSNTIGTPDANSITALTPIPSAQAFVDVEQTFDSEEWERFGQRLGLTMKVPQWQSLLCMGQSIY